MAKHWSEQKERAGAFWLGVTQFITLYTPKFCLKICAFFVSLGYFLFLKNERENIKNFLSLALGREPKLREIYANFYNFALSICEKILVWNDRIDLSDIDTQNSAKTALSDGVGKILLTSHFGNIEIARALCVGLSEIKINILFFRKHNENFTKMIEQMGGGVKILYVSELGMSEMFRIKELLERGEHIAIMGDRVPINSDKFACANFLGRAANFPTGAFLLTKILGREAFSFYCYKGANNRYKLELKSLGYATNERDKSRAIAPLLSAYVSELECKVRENPAQWYNFFDFWGQENDKQRV